MMEANNISLFEPFEKTRDGFLLVPLELCHLWNSSKPFKCLEHSPKTNSSAKIRTTVLGIMAMISLIGNILTILSIRNSRTCRNRKINQSWSSVYALILHLSVSDLLVTVFCIAGEAMWSFTVEWKAGNILCKLFKFSEMFSLYLSTFILVLIGLDRFVAVRYPIKAFSTTKRCSKFVIGAWILSCLLSLPQLIIFHVGIGPFYEDFYQCVTYGFYTEPWQEQLYTTFSFLCMFMVPLLILAASYTSTIITISKSDKFFSFEGPRRVIDLDFNRRRLIHKAKVKAFRISLVIVVTFVVWWTPYYIMMIIFVFLNPDKYLSEELQKGIFFFGMSNSLVNPLIYGAFHLWKPSKNKKTRYASFKIFDYSCLQE
ncbi:gonadotropin-releasing hormone receptor [Cimex lectularius]|uniref:G-protein coupled receptors family 1 profile domain-containing protein n=1 Tax=Cimex lectularius TaxID=79782 RepID=A0A8I6SV41_CIMLE|nr:gonadotropin-releasing hormone receptor [Cimex lectularius]XP_024086061.1 gonadotropin-releasing hormone receptor [Cimex lectularius]XP_024086062.1 gonadotropin-releasing hormone receptor [Cimex lectularius]